MEVISPPWYNFPSTVCFNKSNLSVRKSLDPTLSFPSSSSSSSLLTSRRCNLVVRRALPSFVVRKRERLLVSCSKVKVGDEVDNAEACELVNGSELKIGEGNDVVHAHFFQAVKNNNGVGILLLSDIFGFDNSYTKDFAYRVACNGYNVLVPDYFRGDPWSKDRSQSQLKQWIAELDRNRIAQDIAASTQWMVDKFMTGESSKKLGIIGFCYGGGRVLEVLARDQDSVFGTGISFYGTRLNSSAAQNVKVPVLFVTGDNDPLSPVNTVNEFQGLIGNDSRVVVFEGRGHGFVHTPENVEEDEDAEEAFKIMRNWLQEKLLDIA